MGRGYESTGSERPGKRVREIYNPLINHAVDVQPCVVAEATIIFLSGSILDNWLDSPLGALQLVNYLRVVESSSGTILIHIGIGDVAVFVAHFPRHNLFCLDITRLRVMRYPDIYLVESVLTRFSHTSFKCCHTELNFYRLYNIFFLFCSSVVLRV